MPACWNICTQLCGYRSHGMSRPAVLCYDALLESRQGLKRGGGVCRECVPHTLPKLATLLCCAVLGTDMLAMCLDQRIDDENFNLHDSPGPLTPAELRRCCAVSSRQAARQHKHFLALDILQHWSLGHISSCGAQRLKMGGPVMQGGGLGGEQPAAARRNAGVLAGQPAQAGALPCRQSLCWTRGLGINLWQQDCPEIMCLLCTPASTTPL